MAEDNKSREYNEFKYTQVIDGRVYNINIKCPKENAPTYEEILRRIIIRALRDEGTRSVQIR